MDMIRRPHLPRLLDAAALWDGEAATAHDLAAAHALGALRATQFPVAWEGVEHLSHSLEGAAQGAPLHAAPGTGPTALLDTAEGVAAVYCDRSAVLFRRAADGTLLAPMCAHGAPPEGRPWDDDLAREVLSTHWKEADPAPVTDADWLAPLSGSDMVLPWCPILVAPPDLMAQRKALVHALLCLLHHVSTTRPDPRAGPVHPSVFMDLSRGPWVLRRPHPLSDHAWPTLEGFDMDAIRDDRVVSPLVRGGSTWLFAALDALLPPLFPGRLGWQASIEMRGRPVWTHAPFFSQRHEDAPFVLPSPATSRHARLGREGEAARWRRDLASAGLDPLLSAFLDLPDVGDPRRDVA